MNAILQRAANRQGGLAAAAAARNAPGETSTPQNNDYHKNSFKCSKCHRVRAGSVLPPGAVSCGRCISSSSISNCWSFECMHRALYRT